MWWIEEIEMKKWFPRKYAKFYCDHHRSNKTEPHKTRGGQGIVAKVFNKRKTNANRTRYL